LLFFYFFFFFQAEDGIRDFHVTGVQTCALPIFETDQVQHSMTRDQSTLSYKSLSYEPLKTTIPAVYLPSRSQPKTTVDHPQQYRSEERRVGKECRSR